MNTPLSLSRKVQSERLQKKLFLGWYGGKSCASSTPKADAEMLRAHQRRFLGTLHGGLGRAHFSSTLARAFSRGSLLSPIERMSLRCFTLDLNKWEKAFVFSVLSLISSFFCGPRTNSRCHLMDFITTVFFFLYILYREQTGLNKILKLGINRLREKLDRTNTHR